MHNIYKAYIHIMCVIDIYKAYVHIMCVIDIYKAYIHITCVINILIVWYTVAYVCKKSDFVQCVFFFLPKAVSKVTSFDLENDTMVDIF